MDLGNKIAYYRKHLNITQEALAQRLGVTNQAVSKWESDLCCPDVQLLPKLADIFETTLDELFDRQGKIAAAQLPWENDETLRVVLYIGHRLVSQEEASKEITFCYEGDVLNIDSAISVHCGNVDGNVHAGVKVECGNVGGDASSGVKICCGNISGDVKAGQSVYCGNVDGNVKAGADVTCGYVGGQVVAGGNMTMQ